MAMRAPGREANFVTDGRDFVTDEAGLCDGWRAASGMVSRLFEDPADREKFGLGSRRSDNLQPDR